MLNTIQPQRLLRQYLALLLIFYVIDAVALLCNISLPFGLTYGPLVYLAYKGAKADVIYGLNFHFIPLYLLMFLYLLAAIGELYGANGFGSVHEIYHSALYISVPLSLIVYGLGVCVSAGADAIKDKTFLLAIVVLNMFYGLFFVFSGFQDDSVRHGLLISLQMTLLFAILVVTGYFLRFGYTNDKPVPVVPEKIGEKTTDELRLLVSDSLKAAELYRNPSLTLEMLADKIDIPRHHLSYFLNKYLGKSFYQLIAEYRIDYAKKRLIEDRKITIEGLAHECGFSSKTSLNRYFKEITGLAPSQYRTVAK